MYSLCLLQICLQCHGISNILEIHLVSLKKNFHIYFINLDGIQENIWRYIHVKSLSKNWRLVSFHNSPTNSATSNFNKLGWYVLTAQYTNLPFIADFIATFCICSMLCAVCTHIDHLFLKPGYKRTIRPLLKNLFFNYSESTIRRKHCQRVLLTQV